MEKRYRLKRKFRIKLQGLGLVLLGLMCYKAGADGAMVFIFLCGIILLFGKE